MYDVKLEPHRWKKFSNAWNRSFFAKIHVPQNVSFLGNFGKKSVFFLFGSLSFYLLKSVYTVRFGSSFFSTRSEFYADSESDVGSDRVGQEIRIKAGFREKEPSEWVSESFWGEKIAREWTIDNEHMFI